MDVCGGVDAPAVRCNTPPPLPYGTGHCKPTHRPSGTPAPGPHWPGGKGAGGGVGSQVGAAVGAGAAVCAVAMFVFLLGRKSREGKEELPSVVRGASDLGSRELLDPTGSEDDEGC